MIIRQIDLLMTESEKLRLEEIGNQTRQFWKKISQLSNQGDAETDTEIASKMYALAARYENDPSLIALYEEENKLREEVFSRYKNGVRGHYPTILADIKEAMDAFDKSDFNGFIENNYGSGGPAYNLLFDDPEIENQRLFVALHDYLKNITSFQFNTLAEINAPKDEATAILKATINKFVNLPSENKEEYEERLTKFSKETILTRDRISQAAWRGELTEAPKTFITSSNKAKKLLSVEATIKFDELNKDIKISGISGLTSYDEAVHNAVISLFLVGGNDIITPRMIYRQMTGNANVTLPDQHRQLISDSIDKMSALRVTINTTGERAGYKNLDIEYKGNLLYTKSITARLNGVIVEDCIKILDTPVLYTYANAKNHVSRFPISLLNSSDKVHKTPDVIIIQNYLLKRIDSFKDKKQDKILYSSIYDQLDFQTEGRASINNKKKKVRDHTKTILDHFVSQGLISGYSEDEKDKKTNAIKGVTIHFETSNSSEPS